MRLSYIPDPPTFEKEEDKAILGRIQARRLPDPIWKLDRTPLHSPQIADAFNTVAGAIRGKTSLPADFSETAFLRVAALCNCWYEWDIHAPIARAAGIGEEAIQAILTGDIKNGFLTEQLASVVAYADAVTSPGCIVTDMQVESVKGFLDEKQVCRIDGLYRRLQPRGEVCYCLGCCREEWAATLKDV